MGFACTRPTEQQQAAPYRGPQVDPLAGRTRSGLVTGVVDLEVIESAVVVPPRYASVAQQPTFDILFPAVAGPRDPDAALVGLDSESRSVAL
jgi:hypothetical protein